MNYSEFVYEQKPVPEYNLDPNNALAATQGGFGPLCSNSLESPCL